MSELTESDVFQFARDIATQPFHEELDEETPLKIAVIHNSVMESNCFASGKMVIFEDQHRDELLEKYDIPVRGRDD